MLRKGIALLASLALAGVATAQMDITCVKVGVDGGNQHDFVHYGLVSGIRAYSAATTSCNEGNQVAAWIPSPNPAHPVIAQQLFRYDAQDGAFDMVGMSWLKHSFCAVNESGCGSCQGTPCSTLGIGCADTYWATLNGQYQYSGPRNEINAVMGTNLGNHASPTGNATIRGRLQVHQADIDAFVNDANYRWAWEGQYVAADDHQAGQGGNNVSYREVDFLTVSNIQGVGATEYQRAAMQAWASWDSNALVVKVTNLDEGGPGIHGRFWGGSSYRDLGNGMWRYRYTVYNMNSDRSAGTFEVPLGANVAVSNVYFNDVDYHSGEPYSLADWTVQVGGGSVAWSTQDHAVNANANALRWGTAYTFGFDANSPPQTVAGTIGLFKPGSPSELNFNLQAPSDATEPGMTLCFGDGTGTACPCGNNGAAGEGCATSTGAGITISGTGSTSISSDDLTLTANGVPPLNSYLFYVGTVLVNGGAGQVLFDGVQCSGGDVRRFAPNFQAGGSASDTGFAAQAGAGYFQSGVVYNYQFWTRDVATGASPCGMFSNFSPAYQVTATP